MVIERVPLDDEDVSTDETTVVNDCSSISCPERDHRQSTLSSTMNTREANLEVEEEEEGRG